MAFNRRVDYITSLAIRAAPYVDASLRPIFLGVLLVFVRVILNIVPILVAWEGGLRLGTFAIMNSYSLVVGRGIQATITRGLIFPLA